MEATPGHPSPSETGRLCSSTNSARETKSSDTENTNLLTWQVFSGAASASARAAAITRVSAQPADPAGCG